MTPSDKERIAVVEAILQEHVKNSDTFRVEVKSMLSNHENKDQERTIGIMSKIEELEKKFDETFVQRKEVRAVSGFVGFVVACLSLFGFIHKP